MTCRQLGGVIVCGPDPGNYRKRYRRCETCECITEMVALYELWYGTSWFCCRCGDSWCSEGRYERPFARGWRRRAVAAHRKLWDRASHGPPPDFEAEIAAMDAAVWS